MEINLTEDQREYILKLVKTNKYRDSNEVIQEILLVYRIYQEKGIEKTYNNLNPNYDKKNTGNTVLKPKGENKKQKKAWTNINSNEIKRAYFLILTNYGEIKDQDMLECALIQNKSYKTWWRYVDYLHQSETQNISFTFIWFIRKHLKKELQSPLAIVQNILHHFSYKTTIKYTNDN